MKGASMSDLISRAETERLLREYADRKNANGENSLANGILSAVCFIKKEENIPTAYDVEAVVEKMEEIADKAVGGCHTLEPCPHMADDTKCMECITERFTEVVRNGGKE